MPTEIAQNALLFEFDAFKGLHLTTFRRREVQLSWKTKTNYIAEQILLLIRAKVGHIEHRLD